MVLDMAGDQLEARRIDVGGKTISYHVVGSGPDLLLLHGSGPGVTGLENYRGNIPAFSSHFRTFIPDLPGYGGSDSVDGQQDAVSADVMIGFLDALGIERARIIGNSFGGFVGGRMAASHPDRVEKLITIGGIGFNLFNPFPNEGIVLLTAFTEDPTPARMKQWLESMVYDKSLVTDDLIARRLAQAIEPKTLQTTKKMYSRANMEAARSFNEGPATLKAMEFLTQIKCPTLMCWGRDDRVTALERAVLAMRLIKKCELHVFPDCGHWAMIERKDEFEQTALGFLNRP